MNLFDNICVSERDDGCLDLKIRICDDKLNKNGKALDFNAEDCLRTLINQPLQAKIKGEDFTGHNLKKQYVKDENGNLKEETVLDTYSIGVFTDTYIEEAEDRKYLIADCVMWGNRYRKAKDIILDRVSKGELKGSWEVFPYKSEKAVIDGKQGDLFTEYSLFGFTLLGKKVTPAYDSARILEVAEEEIDELSSAIAQDINNLEKGGEGMEQEKEVIETEVSTEEVIVEETVAEEVVENSEETTEAVEAEKEEQQEEVAEEVEVSSLTLGDIRKKVCRLAWELEKDADYWIYDSIIYPLENTAYFRKEGGETMEEDYLKVVYSIGEDNEISIVSKEDVKMTFVPKESVVEVSEVEGIKAELSEKVDSIVKLGETLAEKEALLSEKDKTIAELEVFKETVAEIEKKKAEEEMAKKRKECSEMALSSGYITEADIEASEELKQAIAEADMGKIKIFIAEAVLKNVVNKTEVSEMEQPKEVEISTDLNSSSNYEYLGESGNPILDFIRKPSKRR